MYQKFANDMPLYWQEQDWKQLGVAFTSATLSNWIIYCVDHYFKPMHDHLYRQLLELKYLMVNETRIQVLNGQERNSETDFFIWVFHSGEDGLLQIILYHYTETRVRYSAVAFQDGYLETMASKDITIFQESSVALVGRTDVDILSMLRQRGNSMIIVMWQFSLARDFSSMNAD